MNPFLNNWNLKLMSLVLAVALWSHVRGEVNPLETATFSVRLDAASPPKFAVQNGAKIPAQVKISLRAPRQMLRELKGGLPANPLAPTEIPALTPVQARAHLDFSLARKGQIEVPVKVETNIEGAEVLGIQPANIVVVLEAR